MKYKSFILIYKYISKVRQWMQLTNLSFSIIFYSPSLKSKLKVFYIYSNISCPIFISIWHSVPTYRPNNQIDPQ